MNIISYIRNEIKLAFCKKHIIDERSTWEFVEEGNKIIGYAYCHNCGGKIKISEVAK